MNKQIAYELQVGETTVKAHVSEILRKLNVYSRTQAVSRFRNSHYAICFVIVGILMSLLQAALENRNGKAGPAVALRLRSMPADAPAAREAALASPA